MATSPNLWVLSDANNTTRVLRLLRFIGRKRRRNVDATDGDRRLLAWLQMQLLASRRGAQSITKEQLAPEPEPHPSVNTAFADENALFDLFSSYSGKRDPKELARWVDDLVEALSALEEPNRSWQDLGDHNQTVITHQIEPLLHRLRELSDRLPAREAPFSSV
jgi:hypothetical protein